MAKYNVWVGGEKSWNRSYMGEVGWYSLTPEQAARWCPDEDSIDTDAIAERLHRDDETPDGPDDFPHRYEIEDGCLGFGAYTDQTFGVSRELPDGEEEVIWSGSFGDLVYGEREEEDDDDEPCPSYTVDCTDPGAQYNAVTKEFDYEPGVVYHHCFKGGWGAVVELPDDVEFDVRRLKFSVTELEGVAEIVTSFQYDGEDYFDDNGSDGKSCEWWLIHNGEFHTL